MLPQKAAVDVAALHLPSWASLRADDLSAEPELTLHPPPCRPHHRPPQASDLLLRLEPAALQLLALLRKHAQLLRVGPAPLPQLALPPGRGVFQVGCVVRGGAIGKAVAPECVFPPVSLIWRSLLTNAVMTCLNVGLLALVCTTLGLGALTHRSQYLPPLPRRIRAAPSGPGPHRMLTLIQLCSVFAVGIIVVLGWLLSTRETNCTKSAKSCNTCLAVHDRYFASAEPLCTAMEVSRQLSNAAHAAVIQVRRTATNAKRNRGEQLEAMCICSRLGAFYNVQTYVCAYRY